ncbi:N-formylglutamate amidohydrolase [Sulfitobacter sp. S190]|uniref:N-formylglutamate amidohydrolase n=1 Tax=Sulfitobacter sp. S190 TaxID=2867022 RepID=UPI0021A47403|nr:N-formylglutamate amidohydrolase [Sulfitobacter sp. S190]UWR22791.1 N-formylglutamate amidohydrolase [Sulfitobacter sp. S190]
MTDTSDYRPFNTFGSERTGGWVVTCDHAANTVPRAIAGGDLGLDPADMARHIAYDPGAAGVSRALAERLNGPALLSNFSRLVIDPNRGEDDPTLLMKLYDGTLIPANRNAGPTERARRLDLCYRPYHGEQARLADRPETAIVSIHSFTPQLRGRPPRPWEIGILYAADQRLSGPTLDLLRAQKDLTVGDNQPYTGALRGDSMDRHALAHGRLHVLIELRNDVIATPAQQDAWADRLAPLLEAARARAHL